MKKEELRTYGVLSSPEIERKVQEIGWNLLLKQLKNSSSNLQAIQDNETCRLKVLLEFAKGVLALLAPIIEDAPRYQKISYANLKTATEKLETDIAEPNLPGAALSGFTIGAALTQLGLEPDAVKGAENSEYVRQGGEKKAQKYRKIWAKLLPEVDAKVKNGMSERRAAKKVAGEYNETAGDDTISFETLRKQYSQYKNSTQP